MNLRCRFAAAITVRSIALATKPHGGQRLAWIRLPQPVRSGWTHIRCRRAAEKRTAKTRGRRYGSSPDPLFETHSESPASWLIGVAGQMLLKLGAVNDAVQYGVA
jgi:hypothetical protein